MTKVVQIQYSTESGGSSAYRLQRVFLEAGIDSSIVSLQQDSFSKERINYLGIKPSIVSKIDGRLQTRLIHSKLEEPGLFSYPILGTNIANLQELQEADYIYIHWVLNGFLNLNSFKKIAKIGKPVIIILHDMWSITGGCHYSFDCEKYLTGCSECPMFVKAKKNDFSKKGFDSKLKFYSQHNNLFFVSPSKWLYDCAKKALLTKDKPVFYIPNALDNTIFKASNKNLAKQILNIDPADTVIAFGAASVNSSRKGWVYLQKALEILHHENQLKNIAVLVFGSGNNKKVAEGIPFKTKFMGYLMDEYSTALVYNAADVFIVPSVADNQPTTVQESLSCGTPVVGFEVGGIPDMIKHKENGYLAKYKDAADLAEGIKYCLQNNLKGYTLPGFKPADIVNKHRELFDAITAQKKIHQDKTQ
jgi:glycosyltransferase involved in cell wall biosynthesis